LTLKVWNWIIVSDNLHKDHSVSTLLVVIV
jgi:hypothetical protein